MDLPFSDLEPGSTIAGHTLGDVLGYGGMGVVFSATQNLLGRKVALKIINPMLATQEEVRLRFIREARVGASVEHPNALPVYEVGDADGVLFISMRYVNGPDLAAVIRDEIYLEADRVVEIVRQIASALDAAHADGLIHRDVKPHNILLARHGTQEHAYLTDFGLARHLLDTGLTGTGAAVGTPAYMAPEQVLGRTLDARADVYGLGVVLFHALTGSVPFDADSTHAILFAHVNETAPRASSVNTNVDPAFDAVIAKALAKDPDKRYQSAGDLGRAAAAALQHEPLSLTPPGPGTSFIAETAPDAFPARITSAFIKSATPKMSLERFEAFLAVLRSRNWTDDDLADRVYPFAPPAWKEEQGSVAIVVVYENLGEWSRTRELLHILPGGSESGLPPAKLGERMKPEPGGSVLSKASVRAVIRNLQRVENRLLDENAISRRVLGKSFERYENDGAGRYFLEEIDRQELDRYLAAATLPVETSGFELDTSERQPLARIPLGVLRSIAVEIDERTHQATVTNGEVLVNDAPLHVTWARPVGDALVEVKLGSKVPALLATLPRDRHADLVSGALIASAVVGHPRRDPAGSAVSFVWTDHLALVAEGDASAAMEHTTVEDEQALHVLELAGRVHIRSANLRAARITERVVLIRIARKYRTGISDEDLYEATRKWWVMRPMQHRPDFAFSVAEGTVRSVYTIRAWQRDEKSGRWAFTGTRDEGMETKYLGTDVTEHLPHGAQNPIRYVNC